MEITFVIAGCAGTQVTVDYRGNLQEAVQAHHAPGYSSAVVGSEITDNQVKPLTFFGLTDLQVWQMSSILLLLT